MSARRPSADDLIVSFYELFHNSYTITDCPRAGSRETSSRLDSNAHHATSSCDAEAVGDAEKCLRWTFVFR